MAERIRTDIDKDPDWWAAWFEADYSWEGLAKRRWEGWVVDVEAQACVPANDAPDGAKTRQATLQDYWRADPEQDWRLRERATLFKPHKGEPVAELIEGGETPDGRIWHIAHLPPADPDGANSGWKSDLGDARWAVLQRLLQVRMDAGRETEFGFRSALKGPDRHAQLTGCVLREAAPAPEDEASPRHMRADQSAHLGPAGYPEAKWGAGADFFGTRFSDEADFYAANFLGHAIFREAGFTGGVDFASADFAGQTTFRDASFSRYADFNGTSFAGDADFEGVNFGDLTHFRSASFSGLTDFYSASFSGHADFQSACFSGGAIFRGASFLRGLRLARGVAPAKATGQLHRQRSEENQSKLRERGVKEMLDEGDFALVLTTAAARREMGGFSGFSFKNALCLGPAEFNDRGFGEAPDFSEARFYDRAEFHRADVHEGARFFQAKFRLDQDCPPLDWEALAAELCKRHGLAPPPERAALRNRSYGQDDKNRTFWRAAFEAWSKYWRSAGAEGAASKARRLPDADLHEAAYRRLKLIMRDIGSHIEEQRFFALELKARQMRTDVKRWELWAAAAYGGLADYGRSAVRPLYWLTGVLAVFAVAYSVLALSAGVVTAPGADAPARSALIHVVDRPHPAAAFARGVAETHIGRKIRILEQGRRLSGPIIFAAEITVVPVANPVSYHDWARRLNERDGGWSTAFSALRLLNRILAVPLLFLFALALRRRFQIG